jgi:ATP-binding cassette, subfamily F, member 3
VARETAVHQVIRAGRPDLALAHSALLAATRALSNSTEAAATVAYEAALSGYEDAGGYDTDLEIEEALREVDLDRGLLDTPFPRLSGGMQTRAGIAGLLFARADLLLMDEPTNHLDLSGLAWLESFLRDFSGGVLLISHDRALLNNVIDEIVYLDDASGEAISHRGGYDSLMQRLENERGRTAAVYRDQQADIMRVRADIARTHQQAQRTEGATTNDYLRGRARKVARKAKARERRLERYLQADERVENPRGHWELKLDFPNVVRSGGAVADIRDASFGYGGRLLLRGVNLEIGYGERIVLLGPKGSGKTTLLRGLLGEVEAQAGTVTLGSGVRPAYLRQEVSDIEEEITPVDMIQRQADYSDSDARTYLHYFLFEGEEALTPVARLSYGERKRLELAAMIVRGVNLLLLDEPMNHLDIQAREKIEAALERFPGTIVAVTHDRDFARQFARRFWLIEQGDQESGVKSLVDPESVGYLAGM